MSFDDFLRDVAGLPPVVVVGVDAVLDTWPSHVGAAAALGVALLTPAAVARDLPTSLV